MGRDAQIGRDAGGAFVEEDLVARYAPDAEASCHPLSCFLSCIFPCVWFSGCITLEEQHSAVILNWGKYTSFTDRAGVHCFNPCGRTVIKISNRQISRDLQNLKVIDSRGNPLLISGVVRYRWKHAIRTALEVEYPQAYVEMQATAVLKQITSQYPYEAVDEPCLRTEADVISKALMRALQSRVNASGAEILGFELNEVAYAPEISAAMLKRQGAQAIIEGREKIVQGAVDIALEAVGELETLGHALQTEEKARIVGNLLTLLCSDQDVVPTIAMGL